MSKLVSIPFFQVGILFVMSSVIWYFITDLENKFKKRVFDFISDGLYYFLLTSFILNIIFNFSEVLKEPYRAILISSQSFWLALLIVSFYLVYREKKKASFTEYKQVYINQTVNFFLLIGLANHLFYYYKYPSLQSVLFILIYFAFFLLKDRIRNPQKNEFILILLALVHAVILFFFGKIVIYYHIAFYPYQIISLFLVASSLVFYLRRGLPSKQK